MPIHSEPRADLRPPRPVEVLAPAPPVAPRRHAPLCPICSSPSSPCFISGAHRMYRCQACATAFVHPMPSAEYLADFYSNYHTVHDGVSEYAEEEKMRAHHPAELARVLHATNNKPGRLLDLGCGKGYFLQVCKDAGIPCQGIEFSDTACQFARDRLNLDVLHGSIHTLHPRLGMFDTITLWGVIEHLPDPVQTLQVAADHLNPGGRLFFYTGVGHDWLDRLLPGLVQWYDPPQHLFVFSAEGARRALLAAGLEPAPIDTNYDYSTARRVARKLRNAVGGVGLRLASELARIKQAPFAMTRFPLAHLMFAWGTKP